MPNALPVGRDPEGRLLRLLCYRSDAVNNGSELGSVCISKRGLQGSCFLDQLPQATQLTANRCCPKSGCIEMVERLVEPYEGILSGTTSKKHVSSPHEIMPQPEHVSGGVRSKRTRRGSLSGVNRLGCPTIKTRLAVHCEISKILLISIGLWRIEIHVVAADEPSQFREWD